MVDIGSNDGIALLPFTRAGIKTVGVEPALNITSIAKESGIETINEYFSQSTSKKIIEKYGKADIVTASNVFAHADNLSEITNSAFHLLKDTGTFIVEVQYLLDTMRDLTFDNIYHEHVNYWSVTSIKNFFEGLGYFVSQVEHIDTHGGSIRVYVSRYQNNVDNDTISCFLSEEEDFGLTTYDAYLKFAKRISNAKINVNENIRKLKNDGLSLVGYGSPAKATTALNYYGITQNEIDYIIDDNPLKHNKMMPGVRIPIFSRDKVNEKMPDVMIVMAWNFFEEIKNNNRDLIEHGVKFISIKELQTKDAKS